MYLIEIVMMIWNQTLIPGTKWGKSIFPTMVYEAWREKKRRNQVKRLGGAIPRMSSHLLKLSTCDLYDLFARGVQNFDSRGIRLRSGSENAKDLWFESQMVPVADARSAALCLSGAYCVHQIETMSPGDSEELDCLSGDAGQI